ncbi:GntR family transcriptional regulator [Microbacterium sp.]|uniref:GntR family transcriptional regulator n=1 Tax=Microbacterium sp. TaxID=51671 RepID=UPI002811653E|nr:GntR family transcriptional regulator [Microbacterium sp.]
MPIPKAEPQDRTPRQLARERVLEQIRDAILRGVLLPGERLDEASLRAWLGVSATPIRQALHALVLEGLVESAPQSHTIVAAPRPDRVIANMQTVGVLMIGTATLALPELARDVRAPLAAKAAGVADLLAAREIPQASSLAGELFLELIERCPNDVLVGIVRKVGTSLGYQVFTAHSALDDDLDAVADAYRALQPALEAGDATQVQNALRRAFLIDRSV